MSLPNPGMDAVPFTPLTAEFLDDMIENIEALSSGSGLSTNAVGGSNIATNAILLGFAENTSDFTTTSTSFVDVTGLSVTVTVPSGSRKVKVEFEGTVQTAGTYLGLALLQDGSYIQNRVLNSTGTNYNVPVHMSRILTPSSGSHTYKVQISGGSAGNTKVTGTAPSSGNSGAGYPYISVTAI